MAPLLLEPVEGEASVFVSADVSAGASVGVAVAEGVRDALGVPK